MVRLSVPAIAVAIAVSAIPAFAQSNTLTLLQQTDPGLPGNRIFVDQSLASNSNIGGLTITDTEDSLSFAPDGGAALQIGGGNSADITVSAADVQVGFSQNSRVDGTTGLETSVLGNVATLDISGVGAAAFLNQAGNGNNGTLTVSGFGATGVIDQVGNGNAGEVDVVGNGATGILRQIGDDNATSFQVVGDGTTATFQVVGSGIANAGATPQVISNGGTVIVTQTAISN